MTKHPVLPSLTSHETPKTRIDLWRKSGMYLKQDFTSFLSLNHNSTETGQKNSLDLGMVQDDRVTHNSIKEDFYEKKSEPEVLQMHAQSDFLTSEHLLSPLRHSTGTRFSSPCAKNTQTFIDCLPKVN